jgi:hypothetical protein
MDKSKHLGKIYPGGNLINRIIYPGRAAAEAPCRTGALVPPVP